MTFEFYMEGGPLSEIVKTLLVISRQQASCGIRGQMGQVSQKYMLNLLRC